MGGCHLTKGQSGRNYFRASGRSDRDTSRVARCFRAVRAGRNWQSSGTSTIDLDRGRANWHRTATNFSAFSRHAGNSPNNWQSRRRYAVSNTSSATTTANKAATTSYRRPSSPKYFPTATIISQRARATTRGAGAGNGGPTAAAVPRRVTNFRLVATSLTRHSASNGNYFGHATGSHLVPTAAK